MDRAVEANFSAPPETQMKKRAPHAPASDKQPEGLIYENVELRSSFSRLGIARTSSALLSAYRKRLKKFRRQKYDLSSKHPNFGDRFTARYIRLQTPSLSDRMPGTTGKSQKSEKLRIATESPPHAADRCPSCAFGFRIGRKSLSPHAKQSIQPTDEQPVAAFDSADFILYL